MELLRQLTDRHVFQQLLAAENLTRAEISARTGISKPTIGESVRRLIDAGVVAESGRQSGGRGRSGTYCELRAEAGAALAISVGPDGVLVDLFDLRGDQLAQVACDVAAPIDGASLRPILVDAVRSAMAQTKAPIRACAVSIAGPIDRATGDLIAMPYAPFLTGEFSVREVLAELVDIPIEVDNDVNWAAVAEHQEGNAADLDDFVLCYLGAGIGGAVVVDGTVVRGARGLAGELAQLRAAGSGGMSRSLIECFADWELTVPSSAAIDVARVRQALAGDRQAEIAAAIATAISSVVALLNPQGVLLGGPWGTAPGLVDLVASRLAELTGAEVDLRTTTLDDAPYRRGIRIRSVEIAREAVIASV